jgi:nucleoid DNA-binding protein
MDESTRAPERKPRLGGELELRVSNRRAQCRTPLRDSGTICDGVGKQFPPERVALLRAGPNRPNQRIAIDCHGASIRRKPVWHLHPRRQVPGPSLYNFAYETLQLIFGLISQKLEAGEDVAIAGFGQWKVRESPGGMRRNPRTGATIKVGPSKKVRFYPSLALKTAVAAKPVAPKRRAARCRA